MDSSATEIRTGLQKNKEVRPQKGFGQKVNKHDSVSVKPGVRSIIVQCTRVATLVESLVCALSLNKTNAFLQHTQVSSPLLSKRRKLHTNNTVCKYNHVF